jgi:hypothetical protein
MTTSSSRSKGVLDRALQHGVQVVEVAVRQPVARRRDVAIEDGPRRGGRQRPGRSPGQSLSGHKPPLVGRSPSTQCSASPIPRLYAAGLRVPGRLARTARAPSAHDVARLLEEGRDAIEQLGAIRHLAVLLPRVATASGTASQRQGCSASRHGDRRHRLLAAHPSVGRAGLPIAGRVVGVRSWSDLATMRGKPPPAVWPGRDNSPLPGRRRRSSPG